MKVIGIIQARMGSSRLPGKVLLPIGTRSMLEHVIGRARKISRIDGLIVATSTLPEEAPILELCARYKISVFRGSALDVLDRFFMAAKEEGADGIVRLTADSPMLDPDVSSQVVAQFREGKLDYVSNGASSGFPLGLGTEAFRYAALERAWTEARGYQRAHVTPYIYEHPDLFAIASVRSPVDMSHLRWTVDTAEDLEFVREVFSRLSDDNEFRWTKVLDCLKRYPHLTKINSHIIQKKLAEG